MNHQLNLYPFIKKKLAKLRKSFEKGVKFWYFTLHGKQKAYICALNLVKTCAVQRLLIATAKRFLGIKKISKPIKYIDNDEVKKDVRIFFLQGHF